MRIPILFDDHALYRDGQSFLEWKEWALANIRSHNFVALCLHDCYADFWLPYYGGFLRELQNLGRFRTLDQVAADTTLAHARWT